MPNNRSTESSAAMLLSKLLLNVLVDKLSNPICSMMIFSCAGFSVDVITCFISLMLLHNKLVFVSLSSIYNLV